MFREEKGLSVAVYNHLKTTQFFITLNRNEIIRNRIRCEFVERVSIFYIRASDSTEKHTNG